ncbi:signal recognition particle-docking protein FtsY [Marinomonas sp. 15G1-11]|uniref:Signal recognition particle receptor FtsY n=1 Tax=Marinomonas phaeophyticola TaxID=3004091 RepID=A0ABT4JUM6_9GAMM|nr:signal recognition particle-docking protein FtsY [Marinomonas sp. 15G1-11]MCZ2722045.1 signal recognition particle-docking protein FtsY [Marinomonas sp. 15G1-11]
MEFVNQIISFFTPYLGEYARYVPIAIGTLMAVIAFYIRRSYVKKIDTEIKTAHEKGSEEGNKTCSPESNNKDSSVDAHLESIKQDLKPIDGSSAAESETLISQPIDTPESPTPSNVPVAHEPQETLTWAQRIKSGLSRTRSGFGNGLASLIVGRKQIDDELLEDIETQLLTADVGVEATQSLLSSITEKLGRKELKDSDALLSSLKAELKDMLSSSEKPLQIGPQEGPFVILMVGVNGVGKTTTIGKLTKKFQAEGKSVLLAAGDTFRAAAVEQLQVWGERNDVPVIAQHSGADSASVIFDAIESAKAKGIDVVIADTAGRLQNKSNLMNELSKVVRVMKKLDVNAPHEVMLVLDAGTGQNALSQAKLFTEAVGVSGIALTKLDGTAKGGIIFAIAKQFGIPIRFIGVGEQVDDLRPFVGAEFVDALFDDV